jgi:hypothetical protein
MRIVQGLLTNFNITRSDPIIDGRRDELLRGRSVTGRHLGGNLFSRLAPSLHSYNPVGIKSILKQV